MLSQSHSGGSVLSPSVTKVHQTAAHQNQLWHSKQSAPLDNQQADDTKNAFLKRMHAKHLIIGSWPQIR